jgi:hypothetical protein
LYDWFVRRFFSLIALLVALGVSAPVRIDDCHVESYHNDVAPFGGLRISFVNLDSVAAREVRFAVDYGGRLAHLVDDGVFAPNVAIRHGFNAYRNSTFFGPAPGRCAVRFVRFADGSAWQAP